MVLPDFTGQYETQPGLVFYSDNISTINVTFTDSTNVSTLQTTASNLVMKDGINIMNLNISSLNFSDTFGKSQLTTTSLSLDTLDSSFSLSGVNSSYDLTVGSGATLDLNVSKVLLSGVPAPVGGQSLIAQGQNGLKWFSITDLLKLEAGIFENDNFSTAAHINFNTTYLTPPAVVITPDSNGSSQLIPVSLNGVTTEGFDVIFGSRRLKHFNFIVLPINSTYSMNVSDNTSVVSTLNASADGEGNRF
jgi:anti-anti-sigma regulatory factor